MLPGVSAAFDATLPTPRDFPATLRDSIRFFTKRLRDVSGENPGFFFFFLAFWTGGRAMRKTEPESELYSVTSVGDPLGGTADFFTGFFAWDVLAVNERNVARCSPARNPPTTETNTRYRGNYFRGGPFVEKNIRKHGAAPI